MKNTCRALLFLLLVFSLTADAADAPDEQQRAKACPSCAEWNAAQKPVRIFGNTYWVGPRGLGAILITSKKGHVLIDGALPESAAMIADNIRALGFRLEDVKLILNSHAHFDHAGGLGELQRVTGAAVAASALSVKELELGASTPDDPQHGVLLPFPAVRNVRTIADGEIVRVGPLALKAHFTPGHTPGGTTWTWRSCEGKRCLDLVYADSQTPISADDFLFTRNTTYPNAVRDFERSESVLAQLPCDILITPHPGASRLWERLEAREPGSADALIDRDACRRYAEASRRQHEKRFESERAASGADAK